MATDIEKKGVIVDQSSGEEDNPGFHHRTAHETAHEAAERGRLATDM